MKIAIFGTGYVGLVTGVCLAQTGNQVTCLDIDEKKISLLKKGKCPIYEPGLEEMIEENTIEKRLFFSVGSKKAIKENDILIIAVGTPPKENGEADLSFVYQVAKTIGEDIDSFKIIVQKSTVPVGTGREVEKTINEQLKKRKKKVDFEVVSNPEFLKEGSAVDDFMKPDRIILGVENHKAQKVLKQLYAPFMKRGFRVIFMNRVSAELTKYMANAMLATRISFINNLSRLAEKVGADIEMIRQGIGSDPRIGKEFLYPSLGYGGSCFPKDVKALIQILKKEKIDDSFFQKVEDVNRDQKEWFANKIFNYYKNDIKGKVFAVWGLSFKAETDDVRESASLIVINKLVEGGSRIQVFDPEAMKTFREMFGNSENIVYAEDEYQALKNANALVVLTEWMQFRNPDFEKIKSLLKKPVIFDGRNLYDPKYLKESGFEYFSIGR